MGGKVKVRGEVTSGDSDGSWRHGGGGKGAAYGVPPVQEQRLCCRRPQPAKDASSAWICCCRRWRLPLGQEAGGLGKSPGAALFASELDGVRVSADAALVAAQR